MRIGGNFRFFNYIRNFQEMYPLDIANYYSGEYPQKTLISIGTGYRDPMLLMTISGSPTKDVSFGTDLILNSPFNGDFRSSLNASHSEWHSAPPYSGTDGPIHYFQPELWCNHSGGPLS